MVDGTEATSLADLLEKLRPNLRLVDGPEPDDSREHLAEQSRRERRHALLVGVGVPDKHARTLAAGRPDQTFAVQAAARWLAGNKLVLLLLGPHDAGKTFAGAAALDHALQRWLTDNTSRPAPRIVAAEHIHRAWLHRDKGTGACDPFTRSNGQQLLTCPLLVIDDLGQEAADLAHITIEAVDTLLRSRCDAGLRTMLTSNLPDLAALIAHLDTRGSRRGQRIGERLTEYGVWRVCKVEGYRRRARGEETST